MGDVKIKAQMEFRCPACGLSAKGTLAMNGAAMKWLDTAWAEHLKACRAKATNPPHSGAQEG